MNIIIVTSFIFLENIFAVACQKILKKNNNYILGMIVIFYGLIFSLRSFDFPDTNNYYNAFVDLKSSGESLEIMNILLIYIFKWLPYGFRFMCFFYVLLNEIIIIFFIDEIEKCSNNVQNYYDNRTSVLIFILAVYFSYFGFLYNGVIMRQGIAMSLMMLGYIFLYKKGYLKSVACFVIALTFHLSSFLGILLIPMVFLNIKNNKGYLIWYGGIILCWLCNMSLILYKPFKNILLFFNDRFSFLHKYAYYVVNMNYVRYNGRSSYKDILFLILAIIFICMLNNNKDKIIRKILNVYMLGVTLMVLLNSVYIAYRFYDYFLIFIIGLIALFYLSMQGIKRWIYVICTIGTSSILLLIAVRFLYSVK